MSPVMAVSTSALSILHVVHRFPFLLALTLIVVVYRLVLGYSELRQFRQATEFLEKAVEQAPENVPALVGRGVAEIVAGNLPIAEQA
jgi:hypothetical protein